MYRIKPNILMTGIVRITSIAIKQPPNSLFETLGLNSNSITSYSQHDCSWRHNITNISKVSSEQLDLLENCLYYYLLHKEASLSREYGGSGNIYSALSLPPLEIPLKINVDEFIVRRVDLMQKSSDFRIHGDLLISWNDTRLRWNESEWQMENFEIHDSHHIWTPTFTDISECSFSNGCQINTENVQINFDGIITARVNFHYLTNCHINFHRYPEETSDCCLYLTSNKDTITKYNIQTKERQQLHKAIAIKERKKIDNVPIIHEIESIKLMNAETSMWTVEDRTVRVSSISPILHGENLQLCVRARKDMSTLKIALRIPVTIATMLMLVSPLFGDLRTQAFVKISTLMLQTMCFLFLCSMTPVNGFGGLKPKLYTFYEFLFFITFLSILVTLVCLALSRLKRNVPASHNFFLTAKVINHFMCCIEPDSATPYQRHIEDTSFDTISNYDGAVNASDRNIRNTGNNNVSHHALANDYTMEWRQIYMAANNLFSGVCFSIFCFVVIFEIM